MSTVTAIQAKIAAKIANPPVKTYANILLRPKPRLGVKFSTIKLSREEIDRIFNDLLDGDLIKWNWVVGQNHTRYIYMIGEEGDVRITSVSGFYSGAIQNNFKILEEQKLWLKVETLMAGSNWWQDDIPHYCLHNVYTFKGVEPKCKTVILPLITPTGYAWIERWQVI